MKQILVTTTQLNGTWPATSKASALLSKSLSLHHKSHPHLGFQRNHFLVFPYIFITGTEFQNQNFSFDLPMLKCSRVPKSPLTYNSLSSRPCLAPPPSFFSLHFISFYWRSWVICPEGCPQPAHWWCHSTLLCICCQWAMGSQGSMRIRFNPFGQNIGCVLQFFPSGGIWQLVVFLWHWPSWYSTHSSINSRGVHNGDTLIL